MKHNTPKHCIQDEARFEIFYLHKALHDIHFPPDMYSLEQARRRLKYEELFYLQLSLVKQKFIKMRDAKGVMLPRIGEAFNYTYSHLPFPLTGAPKH